MNEGMIHTRKKANLVYACYVQNGLQREEQLINKIQNSDISAAALAAEWSDLWGWGCVWACELTGGLFDIAFSADTLMTTNKFSEIIYFSF